MQSAAASEDPILAEADVIPTSAMRVPDQEAVVPMQDLINQALAHRAELAESRIDLNSRDLSAKAVPQRHAADAGCFCLLRWIGRGRQRKSRDPELR